MVAEHQTALEMIMSKYRSQVSHLVSQTSAGQLVNNLTAKVKLVILYVQVSNRLIKVIFLIPYLSDD